MTTLNSPEFNPIMFLDLQLVGQNPTSIFHFTDAGQPLTWNSNAYAPLHFQRGAIEEAMATQAGSVPTLVMTASNIDRQLAALLGQADLEGATATLWLTDRRLTANPRDAVVITKGEVRDLTLTEATLTFQIVSILGQQERIQIPRRIFQAQCNYVFGSMPHCGVNINVSPITIQSTVQTGSTERYLVIDPAVLAEAGSPASPNDYWDTGYIIMLDGADGLQQRAIQRIEIFSGELRFYLRYPLPLIPAAGDPIAIRRNCRLTKKDCMEYHDGDVSQFGGFVEVPPVRFKPVKVKTPFNAKRHNVAWTPSATTPTGVIPVGQPDPLTLPSTLTVTAAGANINCAECPPYAGTVWDGVLGHQTGYVLYSFTSLDPATKVGFGILTTPASPPTLVPGVRGTVGIVSGGPTTMWLLQCIIAWSDRLTTGNPGWVLRFYCGNTATIDSSGLATGTLTWEGELEGQNPAGDYAVTGNCCSAHPATITVA